MLVIKVETDIITSIPTSSVGQAVLLVIMYIETFKTNVSVFFITSCLCIFIIHELVIYSCHESECAMMWPPDFAIVFEFSRWTVAVKIMGAFIDHRESSNGLPQSATMLLWKFAGALPVGIIYLNVCQVILIIRFSIFYFDKFLESQNLSTERL